MAWAGSFTVGPDAAFAPASSDYDTLNLFEDAADAETPAGGSRIALCRGACGTATNYWAGFTANLSATNNLVIQADSGYACNGTDGDSASPNFKAVITGRQITNQAASGYALYMDWIGLEFNGVDLYLTHDSGGDIQVAKCMFRDRGNHALLVTGASAAFTVNAGGCLFKDVATNDNQGAIYLNDSDVTLNAINCTVWGADAGITGGAYVSIAGTLNCKNCAAAASLNDFVNLTGNTTNVSADDTDSDANTDFTNPLTEDFTIVDGGALDGTGTVVADSWFTSLCSTDFAGTAWANPPSVGCFELAGGSPPAAAPARGKTKINIISMLPLWFLGACVQDRNMGRRDWFKVWRWVK